MNTLLLKQCIRRVDPEKDKKLPRFSHSKLEVWENCNSRYNIQYNLKKRSNDTTLALELGSLCHKVLEEKGKSLKEKKTVDYDYLKELLLNGCTEISEKAEVKIRGVKDLKKSYFEEWYQPDNASGQTYEDKLKKFDEVVHSEMEEDAWVPMHFELPFEFVWRDKYIIHGFIDRLDEKDGEYRVVDYKTSKKVFDDKKLPTAQQMGIYGCAILSLFNKLPIEYKYRFILINEMQYALTQNWEARLIKKLDKMFDAIAESDKTGIYAPKPSPLCYYCSYCENNPHATQYKDECQYYSLWRPDNKTFEKKNEWTPNSTNNMMKLNDKNNNSDVKNSVKRKLIF